MAPPMAPQWPFVGRRFINPLPDGMPHAKQPSVPTSIRRWSAADVRLATPHAAHAGAEIDRRRTEPLRRVRAACGGRPGSTVKRVDDGGGDKARARRIDVAIAVARLLSGIEALRNDQRQVVLGA